MSRHRCPCFSARNILRRFLRTSPRWRRRALALGVAAAALAAPGSLAAATATDHGEDRTPVVRKALQNGKAKNVILIIGDGMDDSMITAARNYEYGAAGRLEGIDELPLTGQYTTYSLDKVSGKPNYVTDSAASASGWSTGIKTYNDAISVDLKGNPARTMLQNAKARGLRTGNITTTAVQDATPAAQVANVAHRGCFGPRETRDQCRDQAPENGGAGSITEQLLSTAPHVVMGGGRKSFQQSASAGAWAGGTLLEQASQKAGYTVVTDMETLGGIEERALPVLGLFADDDLPNEWTGNPATATGGKETAQRCHINQERSPNIPSLEAMTEKSLQLLTGGDRGFFLQIEGGNIDKSEHAADPCGAIGETITLDRAVKRALDFAKDDGQTLVIVTADHGHSTQIVAPYATTPGLTRTLLTRDEAPMTLNYATDMAGHSQRHTGTQVRIAAFGPRAANIVGLTDQTELFTTVNDALAAPELSPAAAVPPPGVVGKSHRDTPGGAVGAESNLAAPALEALASTGALWGPASVPLLLILAVIGVVLTRLSKRKIGA